ncbi:MAG: metallophosphoesterase [Candidatus Methylomirabilales bacterium]
MKILAVSDEVLDHLYSPAVLERFGAVDLVVGCGDLPAYYLDYIVSMLNVPLLQVPGNHDPACFPFHEDDPAASAATRRGRGNIDGRVVRERDWLVAGLGGSVRYRPGVHQYSQAEMSRRVLRLVPSLLVNKARHGRYLDILVTHAPPKGIHDAADPAHVGFAAFNRLMARFRPRYLLHGHAHVWRRDTVTETRVGETLVVNVCPFRVIEAPAAHGG